MKTSRWLIVMIIVSVVQQLYAQHVLYLSPKPNSDLVSRTTNIIIRCDGDVDPASLSPAVLVVSGSISGGHDGNLTLSDDGKTLIFLPESGFAPGEHVSVLSRKGLKTSGGADIDHINYAFTTTPLQEPLTRRYGVDDERVFRIDESARLAAVRPMIAPTVAADSLPVDFPRIQIDSINNPSPGNFFMATADFAEGVGYFVFTLDNAGHVVKYKRIGNHAYDFKQEANGLLSYGEAQSDWVYAGGSRTVHRLVDTSLAPVDSFKAGNGYDADGHEFKVMPNGHVLLHAYDIQYFDLSKTIPGGNPNAIVVGSILQELDLSKNVVFQWRSWDYIPISDTYMATNASAFDYIHVNAYDFDVDGDILASFRNTCEIVKISRMTGEMLWRMGGKHNEFTFIGENAANAPTYFTYAHSLRRLDNGNFLLFDNGNLHPVKYSRGVEYRIDEQNKTATLVWEYRHTPDIFAPARGSVQRMPNGNTVIGWGAAPLSGVGRQSLTEVMPDKSTAFEMEFLDATVSYRALKFVVNAPSVPLASVTDFDLLPGNSYSFKKGDSVLTGVSMFIQQSNAGYNNASVKRYGSSPLNITFAGEQPFVQPTRWVIRHVALAPFTVDLTFDSTALSSYAGRQRAVIYARNTEGQGDFAPLTSIYDPQNQSITVTVNTFGEFIIGVSDRIPSPQSPTLVEPLVDARVNQTLPIMLRWSSYGHITGSHLQISPDSLFVSPSVNDSTLKTSALLWSGASAGTRYFWRARVKNEEGISGWSSTGSFSTAPPFIAVTDPAAGAKVTLGAQTVIRWESNFGALVNIRLYRNGVFTLKIIDSTVNTGRYAWKADSNKVNADTTYTIRILISADTTMFAESRKFSIGRTTGVKDDLPVVTDFALLQNYPNPFNPKTVLSYMLPVVSHVRLVVYDVLGREVALLVNESKTPGSYSAEFNASGLASGVYIYRLMAGNSVACRKMVLMK